MKKNIIRLFMSLIVFSWLLSSCDVLNLKPEDQYSINNYWNTEEQCSRFMRGLHYRLRSRAEVMIKMGELRGGSLNTNSITSIGESAFDIEAVRNNLSVEHPCISNWGNFYMDIYQINHAIDKISNECTYLSEQQRNVYLGQLHGLRAYYYFHLLRTYGGVPLCDKPDVLNTGDLDKLDKPRSSEKEIYEFIKNDVNISVTSFELAAESLSDYYSVKTFWNYAASCCLKAEVILWGVKVKSMDGDLLLVDSEQELNSALMALYGLKDAYRLNCKYSDAFSPNEKDLNPEIIFAIRYNQGEKNNFYSKWTYNTAIFTKFFDKNGKSIGNILNIASGALRFEYSLDFYNSYSDNDLRRDATLYQFYKKDIDGNISPAGRSLCKFIGEKHNGQFQYTNDVPVYRYADLILLAAEIECEQGNLSNALELVKKIRSRAGLEIHIDDFLTQESTEKAILKERIHEFAAEGKVWYDKRRIFGGEYALKLVGGDKQKLVWPIDAGVLSKDLKVKQNKGY